MTPDAQRLAEMFYDALQRQPLERCSRTLGIGTRDFDPTTVTGEMLVAAGQFLLDTGKVILPPDPNIFEMVAHEDGRRSRSRYPDRIIAWQYLGQINRHGKPHNAPSWIAERMRSEMVGFGKRVMYLQTTNCSLPKLVVVGDWVVRLDDTRDHGRPRIITLTAAEVERWYSPARP